MDSVLLFWTVLSGMAGAGLGLLGLEVPGWIRAWRRRNDPPVAYFVPGLVSRIRDEDFVRTEAEKAAGF